MSDEPLDWKAAWYALDHDTKAEITRMHAELEEAKQRAYDLAIAITGGEDAPGYVDSISTEVLLQLAKDERNRNRDTEDQLAEAEARGRQRAIVDAAAVAEAEGNWHGRAIAERIRALGKKE